MINGHNARISEILTTRIRRGSRFLFENYFLYTDSFDMPFTMFSFTLFYSSFLLHIFPLQIHLTCLSQFFPSLFFILHFSYILFLYHTNFWNIDPIDPEERMTYLEKMAAWAEREALINSTLDFKGGA